MIICSRKCIVYFTSPRLKQFNNSLKNNKMKLLTKELEKRFEKVGSQESVKILS